MLEAALRCARSGMVVFPLHWVENGQCTCGNPACKSVGKHPLTVHGFKDASKDEDVIRGWWQRWPKANIGLVTGSASRLLVLDIDPEHGGEESFATLEAKYGRFPPTLEVQTGGGGRHLYFALAEGQIIHGFVGTKLGRGLDVRSEGNYVLIPPSETKQPYAWLRMVKPIPIPAWFSQLLLTPAPAKPRPNGATIAEGQRNDTLFRDACAMRRRGLPLAAIEAALLAENAQLCNPPLPESEVRLLAQSVMRYPPAEEKTPPAEVHDQTEKTAILEPKQLNIPDMPTTVLDGRLGEICQSRFADLPLAYSWPALLVAASALLHPQENARIRANLYVSLVGPVHSGKSTCIDRANFLLDVKDPLLRDLKSGSAEGLLKAIGDQSGQGILFSPDELSHLFEKIGISNASFAYVLNTLFYKDRQELTIAKGQKVFFNARLSIVGGIVDEKFEDNFGTATTAGLYDRFMLGQCPSGFEFFWRPIEGSPSITEMFDEVPIDADVWTARDEIMRKEKINSRVLEIVLRTAFICAAIDGRNKLLARDLEPAWELARYQARIRTFLEPNHGKTFEGQIALKMLAYLRRHAPEGQWVARRQILRATHAYDYGPALVDRTTRAMIFNGALNVRSEAPPNGGRPKEYLRLGGE